MLRKGSDLATESWVSFDCNMCVCVCYVGCNALCGQSHGFHSIVIYVCECVLCGMEGVLWTESWGLFDCNVCVCVCVCVMWDV